MNRNSGMIKSSKRKPSHLTWFNCVRIHAVVGLADISCRLAKIAPPPIIQNMSNPRRASIETTRPASLLCCPPSGDCVCISSIIHSHSCRFRHTQAVYINCLHILTTPIFRRKQNSGPIPRNIRRFAMIDFVFRCPKSTKIFVSPLYSSSYVHLRSGKLALFFQIGKEFPPFRNSLFVIPAQAGIHTQYE
jgi:hypothetical protein